MSPQAAFKPLKTIGETIIEYRRWKPHSTCEEITQYIKKHWPKCNTNPASVACTLGKAAKKLGDAKLNPGRVARADKAELPSFDPTKNHADEPEETEAEARERIFVRYQAMERLTPKCIGGRLTSLIISGPPGVSKSWTVTEAVKSSGRSRHDGLTNVGGGGPMAVRDTTGDDLEGRVVQHPGWYDYIGGGCTAVGLYHALWNMRNGGLIVFDDCDGVFKDDESLNLLKVATDSTRERLASWRKNASWLDEYEIDKTFDFRGHIIFLTNVDFEETIRRNHPSAEHFRALIDRAAYLCLTLRTARDFMIVLEWKAGGTHGFLNHAPYNLKKNQIDELFAFVRDNQTRFYNLSLRLVGQIAIQMIEDPDNWRNDVSATKMRTI